MAQILAVGSNLSSPVLGNAVRVRRRHGGGVRVRFGVAVGCGRQNGSQNTRAVQCPAASVEGLVSLENSETWRNSEQSRSNLVVERLGNERVLECCERGGEKLKIAVLVSGGVDSSVALRLLCAAGHHCTAFYLKIWFKEDYRNFMPGCPWEEDLKYARAVCDEVGVELRVMHFTEEYWDFVVSHSISEIQAGRTPNPDILCNSRIKFGAFLEHIKEAEFDRVASGHYARVRRILTNDGNGKERTELLLSADQVKDQTYFLSQLRQEQLSKLMFPLGGLSKGEVRELAEALGLVNKSRKDSQGICFLGKVKYNEFIAEEVGVREGRLLEAETGEVLGLHRGFWFHTIGQRQGLGLPNGPWFVVAKDVTNNVVFISRKYYSEDKLRRAFRVSSFNWFAGYPPDSCRLQCKVRHGPRLYDCRIEYDQPQTDGVSATVNLSEDDQGLAPGQYAVFYQDGVCLGSAVITEALGGADELSVSSQALEVATQLFDVTAYKASKPKVSSSLRVSEGSEKILRKTRIRPSRHLEEGKADVKSHNGSGNIIPSSYGDDNAMADVDENIVAVPNSLDSRIETPTDDDQTADWTRLLPRFLLAVLQSISRLVTSGGEIVTGCPEGVVNGTKFMTSGIDIMTGDTKTRSSRNL